MMPKEWDHRRTPEVVVEVVEVAQQLNLAKLMDSCQMLILQVGMCAGRPVDPVRLDSITDSWDMSSTDKSSKHRRASEMVEATRLKIAVWSELICKLTTKRVAYLSGDSEPALLRQNSACSFPI